MKKIYKGACDICIRDVIQVEQKRTTTTTTTNSTPQFG